VYAAFVHRILRAYSRRVGDGDVEALALMLGLAEEIDAATAEAVKGLRACGYSWAEIGARLGITRQAAQQRWGNGKHRTTVRWQTREVVTMFSLSAGDPPGPICSGRYI
jgi:hypothetical protein